MQPKLMNLLQKLVDEEAHIRYEEPSFDGAAGIEAAFAVSAHGDKLYLLRAGMSAVPLEIPLTAPRDFVSEGYVKAVPSDEPGVTIYYLTMDEMDAVANRETNGN